VTAAPANSKHILLIDDTLTDVDVLLDQLRSDVEQIHSAAQRAAGLTRQLLAFSRRQVLQPKIVNLNEIVSNLEKMLRRLISEHITLLAKLEEPLALVKADSGHLTALDGAG
jgi:two-component system cell cycle sensor histidine kinase/response regulator CckA